ncbi:ImmA/IrrE family metallo-endopeptidase [Pseudooceanicola sp. MF1-13]|uniref:ImmA/IrrE family metallo-endopeptidase n=1 Tax=Pseudooceanicola sp. MF1-13 TaxID=3379095 RepID=UPI0038912AF0
MTASSGISWTNPSVKALAKGADPVETIQEVARSLVLKARENGWSGPPFNPIFIAEMLDVRIEANSSISDARLFDTKRGPTIEFNPRQPRERVRFSIAHEIAHLLFPDWAEQIRNRGGTAGSQDEWQLEMLCNIVASELVLPIGSLSDVAEVPSIEELMQKRREYDVSVEAFLMRMAKISVQPVGVFVASPRISESGYRKYFVNYYVGSPTSPRVRLQGFEVPKSSVINSCTAIGHTDSSSEDWITGKSTNVECVGIPGFPGSTFPRVAGFFRFDRAEPNRRLTRYVYGNILEPKNGGSKIICQLVNDKAIKWGGGVARKFGRKYPDAEAQFSREIMSVPQDQRLGETIFAQADVEIQIASIVAQEGFGPSLFPRIRYSALEKGLARVADRALEQNASIHMPRIGTGAAGGDWDTVQEMIDDVMIRAGLTVTIYDPPPKREQLELFD